MAKRSLFWADQIAEKIIKREEKLKRGLRIFRTESGLGASGVPHIGSIGDVLRQYAVTLALQDSGFKSELIAYSDDRDGLRKVPMGFPASLKKYIGVPVTDVPDPFKCHKSFGEHMSSMLLDAIDKIGMKCAFHSATKDYKSGLFNKQIEEILLKYERIGNIIKEMSGQEKFTLIYPYLPVCKKCGRVYTTRVYKVLPKEHKVLYKCDQEFLGKDSKGNRILVKGCGYDGETSYYNGNGKVAWKAEFAMRWSALKIVFEAVGKDIFDSVKINDRICKEVLNFEPPIHAVYELFLEKGGKKISKSIGNVFTPQDWLRYASPESLRLLMFKRFKGTRELNESDIPLYMDETDYLDKVYFGEEKIANEKELNHLKRLFEYVYFLKPPRNPSLRVRYNLLVNLVRVLPIKEKYKIIRGLLFHDKKLKYEEKQLKERIDYAVNWFGVMEKREKPKISLSKDEKNALKELSKYLEKPMNSEEIQNEIFETAKKHGIKFSRFFNIIYLIILGVDKGPRAGHLIKLMGRKRVVKSLKKV